MNHESGVDTSIYSIACANKSIGMATGNFGRIYTFENSFSSGGTLTSVSLSLKPISTFGILGMQPLTANINTVSFTQKLDGFIGGNHVVSTVDKCYASTFHYEPMTSSTLFWYDKVGRLILSQNTKQFNPEHKRWSYTLYDDKGRIKEVGEKTESSEFLIDHVAFKTIFGDVVSGYFNPDVINPDNYLTWINDTGSRTQVTHTYYDDISFAIGSQDNLRSRVASITYEDTFDDDSLTYDYATHYSYDIHGNVKTLYQDIPALYFGIDNVSHRFKKIDYDYDLVSGKVNKVTYQPGEKDQFIHLYYYDADNRITDVYTSEDGVIWEKDALYQYYAHGPLARVNIGQYQVQGMDYVYTLQGWIKGVNSNLLKCENDIGNDGYTGGTNPNAKYAYDAAGYTLGYFDGDYKPIDVTNKWAATTKFESDLYTTRTPDVYRSDLMKGRYNLYNGNIGHMATTLINPTNYEEVTQYLPQANGMAYRYDQLNRIKFARGFDNLDFTNNKWDSTDNTGEKYFNAFTYDQNGNIMSQLRANSENTIFDELSYHYHTKDGQKVSNRLYHVNDNAASNTMADDIDDPGTSFDNSDQYVNSANTYSYDELGNLIKDHSEEINTILWTVSGKVKSVKRDLTSTKKNIIFDYDVMGNRVAKHIYENDNEDLESCAWISSTYYIRDAQGNIMATYEQTTIEQQGASFKLKERYIYGSSRLGLCTDNIELFEPRPKSLMNWESKIYTHALRFKQYELTNHLGNVLATVSDCKIPIRNTQDTTVVDYFLPDVVSSTDYSPFGAPLDGRTFSSEKYKYGFNGQEKDDEINGAGNAYTAMFWEYDARLGRRWNLDPKPTVGISDYSCFGDNPIYYSDPFGDTKPERDLAVKRAKEHANKKTQYSYGSTGGAPGTKNDCAGMVDDVLNYSGYPNDKTSKPRSNWKDGPIINSVSAQAANMQEITFDQLEPGNAVTFKTTRSEHKGPSGKYDHIGIVTGITKTDGKVTAIQVVHMGSKGAVEVTVDISNPSKYLIPKGAFKWDVEEMYSGGNLEGVEIFDEKPKDLPTSIPSIPYNETQLPIQ